ncbi:hypothetical protein PVAND_002486 [Polypedilum vanderplanki]|uniref:Uncharacterized protein n=1 Tax=Polypedilum vanderplanki TaxID=319348 RepID=A0A9J6BR52_POLVA|nr:hypothetical protein PVAND_002486 [Polypedilum vanderplanki]
MLPELLFSVGNTMQEDFGFLNVNNCYTEKTITTSTRDAIDLDSTATFNKNTTKINLEDSSPDINKWPFNYGTNFLKTSVDPLISSVCDQGDNELLKREDSTTIFENMSTTKSRKVENSTEITTHVKRVTTTRTRRKGPLKLRFHHQALPPEYLNHYETQQQNQQIQENLRQQQQQQQTMPMKKKTQTKILSTLPQSPPVATVEKMTSSKGKDVKNNENILSWLQNVLEMQTNNNNEIKSSPKTRNIPIELPAATTTSSSSSTRTQSLNDLPYMGEMTLENMKPRRGRKPKKADICHLIYKNYGTVIPGSQSASTSSTIDKKSTKIIEKSSKILTKNLSETTTTKSSQNEPLNLCIRESKEDSIVISDDNESNDFILPPNGRHELESPLILPIDLTNDIPLPPASRSSTTPPPDYVYWPSAGIFIHPMAFYYQKMMNKKLNNDSSASSSSSSLSSMMNQESSSLWDNQNLSPSSMEMRANDFDVKSEESMSSPPVLSEMLKNTTLDSSKETHASQKRKRSAIFIPPVQTESANSPTNEVSICKFKFTGGSKPSLQEKKILSVDSGGNFRYFSGTGDKNNRGYEFFPRENLMQSSLSSSSHTNAFLNAESAKIPFEFLPTNEINTKLMSLNSPEIVDGNNKIFDQNFFAHPQEIDKNEDRLNRKKKSSNRSSQRAKLEKTFKEKGFLIQTQQLQSAEGATYCKFRQLKKFTRYLFRSWKDYLPMEEGGSSSLSNDCQIHTNDINIETTRSSS